MAAQRQYATIAEFSLWDGATEYTVPTDSLLRRASVIIDGLTRHSIFVADDDGTPSEVAVSDVFRDATCAQVAYWDETDDVTGAESQDGAFSIGSVSIGARSRSSGNGAPNAQQTRIAPEAVQILDNANLIVATTAHT